MATLVCFHAHPDDEAIATAGVMAKAAADGHRVVLVTATRGEHGEVDDGVLRPGEQLWERRVEELTAAAEVLGVARLEFLGYEDSGMMGTPENDAPGAFWQADVDEAAERLARILREERADVLTVYDDHGNYGHPDHIQVHRVGVRAAELAGVGDVFEATMNRDALRRLMQMAAEMAAANAGDAAEAADGPDPGSAPPDVPPPDGPPPDVVETDLEQFGSPEAIITTTVDVTAFIEKKRAAMRAHPSQINDTSFFLAMPDDVFTAAFGTEWFIHRGVPEGTVEDKVI